MSRERNEISTRVTNDERSVLRFVEILIRESEINVTRVMRI